MFHKSIIYHNSFFYFLGFKLFHKCDSTLRNKFMVSFIKKGETVLEPGCGPANIANFLPDKAKYLGFDLNKSFISYGLKKGLNVYLGDVLDKNSYRKADAVIVCDIFHHIKLADRKKFLQNSYFSAKRLFIFCECMKETRGFLRKILYPINHRMFEFLDNDGINDAKYEDIFTEKRLRKEVENGFGFIPKNIKRKTRHFGCDLVAVFLKE